MRLQWSPRALEQAETAFDYIAEDRPQAAQGWLLGLFERVELLLQLPQQGRVVPEANREDLRELIYEERHRIVYRLDPDCIHVLLVHPSPIPMSPEELDHLGSTPLVRTLQKRLSLSQKECHGQAKEVQ